MKITNEDKLKLVMAKDWWETEDLDGKIGKVKVSDGPVGLRCLAVTDSWANDSIYPSVAYPCYQMYYVLLRCHMQSFVLQLGRCHSSLSLLRQSQVSYLLLIQS